MEQSRKEGQPKGDFGIKGRPPAIDCRLPENRSYKLPQKENGRPPALGLCSVRLRRCSSPRMEFPEDSTRMIHSLRVPRETPIYVPLPDLNESVKVSSTEGSPIVTRKLSETK